MITKEKTGSYRFYIIFISLTILLLIISFFIRYFNFKYSYNYGFIYSSLSHLHPYIRVSFLTGLGILVICFIAFISHLLILRKADHKIQFALAFMGSGIASNVLERLIYKKTTDYIYYSLGKYHFNINIADTFIVTSALYLIYVILFKFEQIFHPTEKRTLFFNKPEQSFFIKQVLIIFFISFSVASIFNASFLINLFHDLSLSYTNKNILFYFITLGLLFFISSFFIIIYAINLSKRLIGPIEAMKRFTRELQEGKDFDFTLRQTDRMKDLETIAKDIQEIIKKNQMR